MFSKVEKKIVVQSPVIHALRVDYVYEVPWTAIPEGKISISFEGSGWDRVESIDVASYSVRPYRGDTRTLISYSDSITIETTESLPPSFRDFKLPPILRLLNKTYFVGVYLAHINVDTLTGTERFEAIPLSCPIRLYNNQLLAECQALAGNISVSIGPHPIYHLEKRPSFAFLANLYHEFFSHNESKFNEQFLMSKARCHIRAHFVNIVLERHGIDSVKVFKRWNDSDWLAFPECQMWGFHCAVMIIDEEKNKWVWDPWESRPQGLLTLKQWLYQPDTPIPISLLIGNRSVIDDSFNAAIRRLSYSFLQEQTRQLLQQLIASAIPNSPEYPIRQSHYSLGFFKCHISSDCLEEQQEEFLYGLKKTN